MAAMDSAARRRILDTADRLFYQEGIRAIGVDRIVEESGVGKATLYRHFPTKDDLIATYLKEQERAHWEWFDEIIAQYGGAPKEQLLALVDGTVHLMMEPGYRGCVMLNALAEFSNDSHPAHRIAISYKQTLKERLDRICREAGLDDDVLAERLMIMINGALVSVPHLGAEAPAEHLKAMARLLIEEHLQ